MDNLPVYTKPGEHLGPVAFVFSGANFGHHGAIAPGPTALVTAYGRHQFGTAYALPFVFNPSEPTSLRVFIPPFDLGKPWMIGGEIFAGEALGDALVHYLRVQAGVNVSDANRQQFLWLGEHLELHRCVKVRRKRHDDPCIIAIRHELARAIGYAVRESDMPRFSALDADIPADFDVATCWQEVLAGDGIERRTTLDQALAYVIQRLETRLRVFHGISE